MCKLWWTVSKALHRSTKFTVARAPLFYIDAEKLYIALAVPLSWWLNLAWLTEHCYRQKIQLMLHTTLPSYLNFSKILISRIRTQQVIMNWVISRGYALFTTLTTSNSSPSNCPFMFPHIQTRRFLAQTFFPAIPKLDVVRADCLIMWLAKV